MPAEDWTGQQLPHLGRSGDAGIHGRIGAQGLARVGSTPPKRRCTFRRKGAIWEIQLDEQETTVKDTIGMQYIHFLLSHWGKEKECIEIEAVCSQQEYDVRAEDESLSMDDEMHSGELDLNAVDREDVERNVRIVKGHIAAWERQLNATTDPSEQADLQDKITKGKSYVSQNVNRFGKVRPSGPDEEARKRVSAAINAAKRNISRESDIIGKHFHSFVKARGTTFIYNPDRDLSWVLS